MPKPFPKANYEELIREVGLSQYAIFEQGQRVPGEVFKGELNLDYYTCVVAGTGSMTDLCRINVREDARIVVPQSAPVVVIRLLRYDGSHGEPHYNADDQIIVPTLDGTIWRIPRKDAPDHYVSIVGGTNLFTIANAYRLPDQKQGPIGQYVENGASLHIKLEPVH